MAEEIKMMSAFDIFATSQETIDDAKKKSSEESRRQTKYLRISQDGTVAVRVLPLAPIVDAEGNISLPRKGYEYPIKDLLLKICTGQDSKGKDKFAYVSVCNAKYRFPELENDLIELYTSLACEMYADDEKLVKKIRGNSFEGGLRFDSKRCMYVYDLDKRQDGIQILQLSFSQYKEVEERKLTLWEKLIKKNSKQLCPISSIQDAYALEIKRTTENKKVTYSFNIDTVGDQDTLTEEELNTLLNTPRLPEVIYRYSRYHLEATIEYLKQYDEKLGIDVMSETKIKDCIDAIKLLLPADDTSHFTMEGGSNDEDGASDNSLDNLWAIYDKLEEDGLDDKSEEGQELRAAIREFIEANDLDITVGRRDSNLSLLNQIEEALSDENKPASKPAAKAEVEDEPEQSSEGEQACDDEDEEPSSSRASRNDDTNEPAVPARRAARPQRRRG